LKWRWIAGAAALSLLLRASSRRGRAAEAAPQLRSHFARIARLRLVAACQSLDGRIEEQALGELFDWIVAEMCRRTGTCEIGELVHWAVSEGQEGADLVSAQVTRDSVERLPAPVLQAIDGCQGRLFAGVLLHETLMEAGRRSLPELRRHAAAEQRSLAPHRAFETPTA
jgi:hypothetical protein